MATTMDGGWTGNRDRSGETSWMCVSTVAGAVKTRHPSSKAVLMPRRLRARRRGGADSVAEEAARNAPCVHE